MIWPGVPLGFDRNGRPIVYNADDDGSGNAPTLVFGPPGASKTVGLICTQLLDDDSARSYDVIDPKGEICAITSKFRRSLPGHTVKIINPYGLLVDKRPDMKSDGWNPLGDLDPTATTTFGDECQAKGEALIKTASNESQPHFPDSARSGVTGVIMAEVKEAHAQKRAPSLSKMREILTQEPKALRASIEKLLASGDYDIRTRAAKFLNENTEIENIKSTIETQTAWMTKPMRDDMDTISGVDFRECAKQPTTIYVIIPATELQSKANYIRLILSSALRHLYRHGGIPATIIIEEAFVLGYHAEVEQALSILRGFGSRMTVVFQSLTQMKKLYPQTHGLFTAGAVVAFRPGDLETAKWMVERAGKSIVPVLSAADPSNPSGLGTRPSWQQQLRERIPLAKMFGMPKGRALVWKPGDEVPRVSWVKGYFAIPNLNARASENPYYRPNQTDEPRSPEAADARKGGSSTGLVLASTIIGLLLLFFFTR